MTGPEAPESGKDKVKAGLDDQMRPGFAFINAARRHTRSAHPADRKTHNSRATFTKSRSDELRQCHRWLLREERIAPSDHEGFI
jgi:hypothetical protein